MFLRRIIKPPKSPDRTRIRTRKPEGIEKRKAYIIGGGIAGMATAAFLVKDGHMPAENVTIYEQMKSVGGSMDGSGNAVDGYINRGDRELEPDMECLWYLFGMVPSLEEEGRTVLDETRECNKELPMYAKKRIFEHDLHPRDLSSLGLSEADMENFMKMQIVPESEIENVSIEQWFTPDFFKSNLWYLWATMLAFQPHYSLMEIKRYCSRFLSHLEGIEHLEGTLRSKYNQYDSFIRPLYVWLEKMGVNFVTRTTIEDIELEIEGDKKTVKSLEIRQDGEKKRIPVREEDLVYFTNGCMTQNSTYGGNKTVAKLNRNAKDKGCFTVWEKLAKQSPVFGKPEKFISDPDKTNFITFTITITDYPDFVKYLEDLTENVAGSSGMISLIDSPWWLGPHVPLQPYYVGQPDNVQVIFGNGLHTSEIGEYIKKPMTECTGEEILQELLYHFNYLDKYEEMLPHVKIRTAMMPYIMSQFMPRGLTDRPQVIPEGCTNLAFIGQFVELEGDVVFTVETSIRTAMIAVYRTLHLDKPITPIYEGQYDIRVIVSALKKTLGVQTITKENLPALDPTALPELTDQLLKMLNEIPKVKGYYAEIEENK